MDPSHDMSSARQNGQPSDLPRPPDACQTMTHVRAGIDHLDRRLVALMADRQRYIEAAARIKQDRELVRDPARIEDVVEKVLRAAEAHGLNTEIAETVWRTLISLSIDHEFDAFDRDAGGATPRRATPTDVAAMAGTNK